MYRVVRREQHWAGGMPQSSPSRVQKRSSHSLETAFFTARCRAFRAGNRDGRERDGIHFTHGTNRLPEARTCGHDIVHEDQTVIGETRARAHRTMHVCRARRPRQPRLVLERPRDAQCMRIHTHPECLPAQEVPMPVAAPPNCLGTGGQGHKFQRTPRDTVRCRRWQ